MTLAARRNKVGEEEEESGEGISFEIERRKVLTAYKKGLLHIQEKRSVTFFGLLQR